MPFCVFALAKLLSTWCLRYINLSRKALVHDQVRDCHEGTSKLQFILTNTAASPCRSSISFCRLCNPVLATPQQSMHRSWWFYITLLGTQLH